MNITLDELRTIKHNLPTGSIRKIADELNLDEQVVRNYFGAHHLENSGNHIQPGPNGGIVHIEDERILNLAKRLIQENAKQN
ncbi:MAG: DNA-binding protein [Saprospiraceae bacterium]|nr:DNA-binding protein [Saprospiraceae bacterium]HRG68180.1 DNA-binding protein [Saprospiraceae bacterium]